MIARQAQRKEQEAKNKLALDLQIAKNQNAKRQSEAEKKADKEKVLQELKAYEDEQQQLKEKLLYERKNNQTEVTR
jgi:hypothetical protein